MSIVAFTMLIFKSYLKVKYSKIIAFKVAKALHAKNDAHNSNNRKYSSQNLKNQIMFRFIHLFFLIVFYMPIQFYPAFLDCLLPPAQARRNGIPRRLQSCTHSHIP